MVRRPILILILVTLLAVTVLQITLTAPKAVAQEEVEVTIDEKYVIDSVGNAHYESVSKFKLATYMILKQVYGSNPYLLVRHLRAQEKGIVSNLHPEFIDAENKLKITFDIAGVAVNKKTHWEIYVGKGLKLTSRSGTTLIFTSSGYTIFGLTLITTTIELPGDAGNIEFDEGTGVIKYTLPGSIISDENRTIFSAIFLVIGAISGLYAFITYRKMGRIRPTYIPPPPPPPSQPPRVAVPPQPAARRPPPPGYKYCRNCGALIPLNATVCPVCRQPQ